MEYISTAALSNELDMKSSDLFEKLRTLGWVDKRNDKWILTDLGKQKGGQTRTNPKFGEYVVWLENISIDTENQKEKPRLLNATAIGKQFGISSQRLNLVLSELGWIHKNIAGWDVTKLGKSIGGKQFEADQGFTYVIWPENILQNKNLTSVFKEIPSSGDQSKTQQTQKESPTPVVKHGNDNFRDKFPAALRTKDGHMVRSRAEVIIDNALYDYKSRSAGFSSCVIVVLKRPAQQFCNART